MTAASIEARTLTLARLERAAGHAFGYEEDGSSVPRLALFGPTSLLVAALATTLAATLLYLI